MTSSTVSAAALALTVLALAGCGGESPPDSQRSSTPTLGAIGRSAFVTPDIFVIPDTGKLRDLLVAGCDPSWVQRDFPERGVHACYPDGWIADSSISHSVLIQMPGSGEQTDVSLNIEPDSNGLGCAEPKTIAIPIGDVAICAVAPQFGGQSHHVRLPNGVVTFVYVADAASADERAAAFRVAMSVVRTP